jgi:hypothetical protein
MYGTGWIPYAGKPPAYGDNLSYGNAAPPYQPQVENQTTGNTFNSNEGYYGQNHYGAQQNGFELQQPSGAHVRSGENVYQNEEYQAPVGPPPSKTANY